MVARGATGSKGLCERMGVLANGIGQSDRAMMTQGVLNGILVGSTEH
jgi:hypothetical protein